MRFNSKYEDKPVVVRGSGLNPALSCKNSNNLVRKDAVNQVVAAFTPWVLHIVAALYLEPKIKKRDDVFAANTSVC